MILLIHQQNIIGFNIMILQNFTSVREPVIRFSVEASHIGGAKKAE